MTRDPSCLRRDDTARHAAQVMRDKDCGVVPIVDDGRRVIGVVTDRDLAIRGIAAGKGPDTRLNDLMTTSVHCCTQDDDLRDVERKMAELQVRRICIVDAGGRCMGIISQADIARAARDNAVTEQEVALVVEQISQPTQRSRPRTDSDTTREATAQL
jgi:CBS domain-containing protein